MINTNDYPILYKIITKAMLQMGFSPENNGFYFLRESVLLACVDSEAVTLVTKLIYAPVAKTFNTSPANIEKSIRLCAKKAWHSNTKNGVGNTIAVLNTFYTFTESRPENKELITLLSDIVKNVVNLFDTDISQSIQI